MFQVVGSLLWFSIIGAEITPALGTKYSSTPQGYFPTAVGTKLVYRKKNRDGEDLDHQVTDVVTEFEQGLHFNVITISSASKYKDIFVPIVDGKPQETGYDVLESAHRYLLTTNGIFYVAEVAAKKDLREGNKPFCILKLPPKTGVNWSFGTPADVYHTTYTIGKPEQIKVPAGTFEAISVRRESFHIGEVCPSVNYWYAKGIGRIKLEIVGGSVEELASIVIPPRFAPPAGPIDLFKKAIAAKGGTNGPEYQEMVHLSGEGTVFEGNAKTPIVVERWNLGPIRQRTEITKITDGRKSIEVSVLDNDKAWSKCNEEPAKPIDGATLEIFKEQVNSADMTLQKLLDDKGVTLSMAGERFRGGEPCWCVLVRRPGASNQVLSFSKKTHLLMAKCSTVKTDDGEKTREAVYSDYRKLGDRFVAHRHETFEDLRLVARVELKKITPIKTLHEKLLAMPK